MEKIGNLEIVDVEVLDNAESFYSETQEEEVYSILEVSVFVTVKNEDGAEMSIDFQTTQGHSGQGSTRLEAYHHDNFDLDFFSDDEDIANKIIEEIKEKLEIQRVYKDYIERNFKIINDNPYTEASWSKYDFQAERV